MVSMLSVGFAGSKKTRLLKHGRAGKLVEYVDASWMAKPCGRSSRSITLREPPLFGVCAVASEAAAMIRAMTRAGCSMRRAKRKRVIVFPFLVAVSASLPGPAERACLWRENTGGPEKVPRDASTIPRRPAPRQLGG